jgi:hypothetical protein
MKRMGNKEQKNGGMFAYIWPEWLTVEDTFHLDVGWICLKDSTCMAKLAILYRNTISRGLENRSSSANREFCLQLAKVATYFASIVEVCDFGSDLYFPPEETF